MRGLVSKWSFSTARQRTIACLIPAITLAGCGTQVPQIQEVWEGPDITGDMEFRIKANIFCETVKALRTINAKYKYNGQKPIPDNYGVQMQIALTAEEGGAANPGVTFNRTLSNASVAGVSVGQMSNVGVGATLSSTVTRVDTSYSYFNVGKITRKGANKSCDNLDVGSGSSPLLRSELGIESYLTGAAKAARVIHSSAAPKNGGASLKLDVYSYDIKFVIVSNGSVTPSWKLVNISANTGNLPLFSAGRTRTHDLTLTFGPSDPADAGRPSATALQTHFTSQVIQSNQRRPAP